MIQTGEKSKITIATHSGQFHADDIFAVATIVLMFEEKYQIKIIRTRNINIINDADFSIDVGGVYDHKKNRFDHHQNGGAGKRENNIPYSSFGLVWKKYGKILCGSKDIADELDKKLIWSIDARDNGIAVSKPVREGIYMYDIGDFFAAYKVTWKEPEVKLYENFMYCVNVTKNLIEREIKNIKDTLYTEKIIEREYYKMEDERLLILNKYYPRRIDCLSKYKQLLLVVSPKLTDNTWAVETVRISERTYINRINLPKSWAGKRNDQLEKITGVKGSIFCHNNGFVVIN